MKKLFLLLIILLNFTSVKAFEEAPAAYTVIEDEAKLPLLSPTFSERKTLKIRLANGLEALLISDPKADKSAAALAVRIGSWDDPKENNGMAHFLEHMLFLGTKKYPDPSEYSAFIAEHDGISNAFTSATYTAYMFSVDNSAFEPALDRFSRFFYEPIFDPTYVSRELQVIDQEYAKNLDDDDWRGHYVWKDLANPEHPNHNFNIGNRESLSKATQTALKQWYHNHYSSNLMSLIVYSTLPLDKLQQLVVEDFSNVVNSDKKATKYPGPIFPNHLHDSMVYIEPIKDVRTLSIIWELPEKFVQMKETRPDSLLCTIVGHEGDESLLTELKREKLAEQLSCGTGNLGLDNKTIYIDVVLTDEGLRNVNTVIERVYQTLARFRAEKIPAYLFDEAHRMGTINYQYHPRQDAFEYVSGFIGSLVNEEMKTVPEQSLIIQKFDPEAMKELLDYLTPQNAYYDLLAPEDVTGVKFDKQEPWLKAAYAVKKIDPKWIEKWKEASVNPEILLPVPNPFIPNGLTVFDHSGKAEIRLTPLPEALINNEKGLVYFAQDTQFLVPEVYLSFKIKTPSFDMGNSLKIALADLYVDVITEELKGISYPASAAGLHYDISRDDYALRVTVQGYSDKADLLFRDIVKQLKNARPTEQQFEIYKDSLRRNYENTARKPAIEQGAELMKKALYRKYSLDKQKAKVIDSIDYEKFNEYVDSLFDETYIQGVVYGNIHKQEALSLTEELFKNIDGKVFPKKDRKEPEVIMLPEDKGPYYYESKATAQGNAAILAIEYPSYSYRNHAALQVLMQAIKEPFFSELRTKQQTGYMLFSYPRDLEKHLFGFFAVQSGTHSARDLLARFELFNENFLKTIGEEVPEKRFEVIRTTLVKALKDSVKDLGEMGDLLLLMAFKYEDFDRLENRIKGFNDLTYSEFLDFAHKFLNKENRRRLAILIRGTAPDHVLDYRSLPNLNQLHQLGEYP